MLTTIAVGLASGLAGGAISVAALSWRLRGRVSAMDEALHSVCETVPALVTRFEVSNAFRELAEMEAQRQAAVQRRAFVTNPGFQPGSGPSNVPVDPMARGPVVAPGVAEMNALLSQQLAAMNERLRQITNTAGAPAPTAAPMNGQGGMPLGM